MWTRSHIALHQVDKDYPSLCVEGTMWFVVENRLKGTSKVSSSLKDRLAYALYTLLCISSYTSIKLLSTTDAKEKWIFFFGEINVPLSCLNH